MINAIAALIFQVGLGYTHANPQDCGIWYVCSPDSPYTLHQNSLDISAGVEDSGYRVGFEKLGTFETDSFVKDNGGYSAYYHVVGKQRGVYVEKTYKHGAFEFDYGLWLYRTTVAGDGYGFPNGHHYTSGGNGFGPIIAAGYELCGFNVSTSLRGAESRARDWNGNHQPSPIKGFTETITVRYSF